MNTLAFICLKLVRWTGWLLLPVVLAFLRTGYAMSGRYGLERADGREEPPSPCTNSCTCHWPCWCSCM